VNNLGIVIPVYKDPKGLETAILKIRELYPNTKIIVVADDIESANVARELNVFVPYHYKRIGFSKSLCEGLCYAWYSFKCDYVIIADSDHPFEFIDDFIEMLKTHDVVVGHESGVWKKSRVWSNMLVKKLLVNDVFNPTCGFVAFRGSILSKIPWDKMKSEYDMIHPELLYYAKKNGALLGSCNFDEVQKIRYYAPERYISWLLSFIHILLIKSFGD
jgi:hypothetical protein